MRVCVCVRACVRACVRVCVRVYTYAVLVKCVLMPKRESAKLLVNTFNIFVCLFVRQSKQHNILTHENVCCGLGRNKDVGMGL